MYNFICFIPIFTGGRRGVVSVGHVLQFVTGSSEEPLLGFRIKPTIYFVESSTTGFLPTANTCSNRLNLSLPSPGNPLPDDTTLFELFDYAFLNTYFGMVWRICVCPLWEHRRCDSSASIVFIPRLIYKMYIQNYDDKVVLSKQVTVMLQTNTHWWYDCQSYMYIWVAKKVPEMSKQC